MQHVRDDFEEPCPSGRTIGTLSTYGNLRRGVDAESRIRVDQGALRFQPLLRDGWGRQGIAYGPLSADGRLAFAVGVLNGHGASQVGDLQQSLGARLVTWLRAGGTLRTRDRLVRWLRFGQHRLTGRQLLRWALRDPRFHDGSRLDENLAVGWFTALAPRAPQDAEVGFLMHSSEAENGELWVRVDGKNLPVVHGLPNVPLLLVVAQFGVHATYYAASSEPTAGLPRCPALRPLAVTRCSAGSYVFPGIHQSVLGQIGFRVDSRVYGARVASLASPPGLWTGRDSPRGWSQLPFAAGLVHVVWDESRWACPTLMFGGEGEGERFALQIEAARVRLRRALNGEWIPLADEPRPTAVSGDRSSLQLLADQGALRIVLDGTTCFEPLHVGALTRFGASLDTEPSATGPLRVDVYPTQIPVPLALRVALPSVEQGHHVCVDESFRGFPCELSGRRLAPGITWKKDFGAARLVTTPNGGVRVQDAARLTSRGRTVYTIPWSHADFAELEIRVTPPGQRQGEGEEGRAGVVFWQDADNYLIVGTWLHDHYGGASISSFYCLGGFEDIYDAVWTNIGRRIRWGVRYALRVAFDGERFTASVDGQVVLQRALGDVHRRISRLKVQRVGIVSNWEWGNDTGSVFERFVARSRRCQNERVPRGCRGPLVFNGGPDPWLCPACCSGRAGEVVPTLRDSAAWSRAHSRLEGARERPPPPAVLP